METAQQALDRQLVVEMILAALQDVLEGVAEGERQRRMKTRG